jgi:hypothetical protein
VLARALGFALCAALALIGAAPSRALAQNGQSSHSVSDAVYIGGRLEPDGAWLVDYDLDILLTSPSVGISLGPNVSFAFAADGGTDLGRRQEWLLAADFLRARWAMLSQYGFRVSIVAGAGMWVASFYDQSTQPRDVVLLDGTVVRASEHYPGAYVPGALLSVGASADWFWDASWGLSAYAVGHIRLDQENRMPAFWIELGIGIRLGE